MNAVSEKSLFISPSWAVVFHEHGHSLDDMLERALLSQTGQNEVPVEPRAFVRFWNELLSRFDDEFPYALAHTIPAESLSIVYLQFLVAPSLAVGLERLVRYGRLVGPFNLKLLDDSEKVTLLAAWDVPNVAEPPKLIDSIFCFVVHLARMALRQPSLPAQVLLPRGPTPGADDYFGKPVGIGLASLSFEREVAEAAFVSRNDVTWSSLQPTLEQR